MPPNFESSYTPRQVYKGKFPLPSQFGTNTFLVLATQPELRIETRTLRLLRGADLLNLGELQPARGRTGLFCLGCEEYYQ